MADTKNNIEELRQLNALLEQQKTLALALNNIEQAHAAQIEISANNQKIITELKAKSTELTKEEKKLLKELESNEKAINTQLEKGVNYRQKSVDLARSLGSQMKGIWKYLQETDKTIRSTNLQLGLSGAKAAAMRNSFEESVGLVTRLGGGAADVATVMQGFAEETGRARALTGTMVDNITLIGKGTGLGVEQATKLSAQFEIMGVDTRKTMDYVQSVVDTTERMGVNTTKVLKNVNDNFKRLNTYTFQQGVRGFAEMASYAEKFKIDIIQALNAADVAKTLEGAIDLTAQLQVMGGEFAKTDPFEMLFLSRNDPAKFTEKIADMTKGVVSFRKMADGTFEKYISPADRDRLASVAKSMGMEAGALTEIAQRQADIQKMRKQMGGLGLSKEQKEVIEGAAIFDSKTGKFQVEIAGAMKSIGELTSDQAEAFKTEHVLLEDRAKQAMTFDEQLKATIMMLKVSLLPMLSSFNEKVLPVLSKVADKFLKFSEEKNGWLKIASRLLLVVGGLKIGGTLLNGFVKKWVSGGISKVLGGGASSAIGGGVTSMIPATGAGSSGLAQMRAGKGALDAGKGAGVARMGTGVAAAGIGTGIMLAAKGIGELAEKMKDLDGTQIWALPATMLALSLSFWALSPAIVAAGAAGTAGAIGLIALGAAVVGIGFGINLATKGIGQMAEGLGNMIESSKGAGPAMLQVGAGIGAISLAMMGFTAGAAGFLVFAATMKTLSKHAPAMAVVGDAFKNIQTVLSGSRDDFIAVENAVKSISGANIKGGGYFSELANLLKKPLQVEFANNGKLYLDNDITLQIDGEKFMRKVYKPEIAVQMHEDKKYNK